MRGTSSFHGISKIPGTARIPWNPPISTNCRGAIFGVNQIPGDWHPERRRRADDTGGDSFDPAAARPDRRGREPADQGAARAAAGGGGRPPGGGPPEGGPPELPLELAGRFEVIGDGPAAEGGEAVVWRVRERHSLRKQELALKLYHRGIRSDAKAAAKRRWKSAHLQEIIHDGTADDRHYELTEWLPGGTVADLIGEHRTGLPEPVIRDLVRQLAEALTELHGQQIVHLDVKPANIAIHRPGLPEDIAPPVVLIDFGSARRIEWRIVDHADAPRTPAVRGARDFPGQDRLPLRLVVAGDDVP